MATGRNREVGKSLTNAGAQFVALDLTEATEDDCARLIEGCDAVWHCAAKSSPWGDKTAFWLANVKATHTLAQAAGRLKGGGARRARLPGRGARIPRRACALQKN